jgi:hypothetical protein
MPHYLIEVAYNPSGHAGLLKGPKVLLTAEEAVEAMRRAAESSYQPATG